MYALNTGPDGRVLSVTLSQYAPEGQPRTEALPDGDISDYLWVDGKFVYRPLKSADDTVRATENVAKGSFFSVYGDLYIALTSIARGEPLRRGINCRLTSVEEQLGYLYSRL